jgi:hypothetical protein
MTDTFHGALLAAGAYKLFSAIETHPVCVNSGWDALRVSDARRSSSGAFRGWPPWPVL